jgi:hypothetical protein
MSGDNKPTEKIDLDALEDKIEPSLRTKDDNKSTPGDNKPIKKEDAAEKDWKAEYDLLVKEKENIVLRYDTSSKEGKRLAEELESLKTFEPLINRIGSDEELQQLIQGHIKGGKSKQEEIDPTELLAEPDKYSKYLTETVLNGIDKRLLEFKSEVQQERQKETIEEKRKLNEIDFMKKNNLDSEKMDEFKGWMKKTNLSLEDLWLLKNKNEIFQNISSNRSDETLSHLMKTSKINPSLNSLASMEEEKTNDELVWNAVKQNTTTIADLLNK